MSPNWAVQLSRSQELKNVKINLFYVTWELPNSLLKNLKENIEWKLKINEKEGEDIKKLMICVEEDERGG